MPRGRGRGRGGATRGGRGGSRGGKTAGGRVNKGRKGRGKVVSRGFSNKLRGDEDTKNEAQNLEISIDDVRALFMHSTSFDQHFQSQQKDPAYYQAAMLVLIKHKLELSSGSKARALAAAIARHDHDLSKVMLRMPEVFGMVEVTKALSMLDAKRQLKISEKRLEKLTAMKSELGYKVKDGKFSKLKNKIGNLEALKVKGSLSGAVARQIKKWTSTIPKSELEFYALHFPKEPWKQVADLCHLNPKKDFQLEWFLGYCFGGEAPEDSLVHKCSKITQENLNEVIQSIDIPYAYLKKLKSWFDDKSKLLIAQKHDLTTIIWWFEDLNCPGVRQIIDEKLKAGETVNFSYGKLMERIFTLRENKENKNIVDKLVEHAEKQLREISLTLKSPIAVLGDKSSSMQVCVTTSNIIASLLAMICDAHINFFDSMVVEAPFYPSSVESVLKLSEAIRAGNTTAPAASLYPFYENQQKINTFIVVTDEEENTSYKNFRFAELFKKYKEEVHKAELVFVSFLRSQHDDGQMVRELKKKDIVKNDEIKQFKFDETRPDLTKLDHMFAVLSTSGDWYEVEVRETKSRIETDGLLSAAFNKINLAEEDKQEGWECV
ncbi:uncharacterized protein LOC142343164 [Convolutriloba macropyga]|uniref:uncharacterized protein LOC142343164 n=1 Tax=Convolutriloba macropyga TaxID=536237 RepID=UPI003F527A4F